MAQAKKKKNRSELIIDAKVNELDTMSYKINQDQEILEMSFLAILGILSTLKLDLNLIKRIKDLKLTEGRGQTKNISFKVNLGQPCNFKLPNKCGQRSYLSGIPSLSESGHPLAIASPYSSGHKSSVSTIPSLS